MIRAKFIAALLSVAALVAASTAAARAGFCDTDADCDDGFICNGAETCSDGTCLPGTPPPCTTCSILGNDNCQLPPMAGEGWPAGASGTISDLTVPPNGTVAADDFVPSGNTLSSVCVWGFYHDASLDDYACIDSIDDEFRVRIFEDLAGIPDTDNMVGQSLVTGNNISREHEPGTLWETFYGGGGPGAGALAQGHTLLLDTPISGMITDGRKYWVEIANNTTGSTPAAKTCWWTWMQSYGDPAGGNEVDGYSAGGANSGGTEDPNNYVLAGASRYINGSGRHYDLAMCLGTGPAGADPLPFTNVTPTGACWTCPAESASACSVETMANCVDGTGLKGIWNKDDPDCSDTMDEVLGSIAGSCTGGPFPDPAGADLVSPGLPNCGDGLLDPGEECDPTGETLPTPDCDVNCQVICPPWPTPETGGICYDGANDGLPCLVDADCPDGSCFFTGIPSGLIFTGLYEFNSTFSGTDGSLQVNDEDGQSFVGHDSWFFYETTCTGKMTVSACATGPGVTKRGLVHQDSLLVLYTDKDQTWEDDFICPGADDEFQVGLASNEGCNGIADAGPGILSRLVTPGEKYTIRLTNWGATSETAGAGSQLIDVDCIAHVCPIAAPPVQHTLPDAGGTPRPNKKGRMLAVIVDEPSVAAIQVEFVSLPAPYDLWNGTKMFASPERPVCETGSIGGPNHPAFNSCPINTYLTSQLECTGDPYKTNWNALGVVNLWHEGIVPGAIYNVRVMDGVCDPTRLASFSEPTEMQTAIYGDSVGVGGFHIPANDASAVSDALGAIACFSTAPGKPSKSRTETAKPCISHTANIDDVLSLLGGFLGVPYPERPSTVDACDSVCTKP